MDSPSDSDLGLADFGIQVSGNCVIIRDLKITGPRKHGIYLLNSANVVIEGTEITHWGTWVTDGVNGERFGEIHNSAIYSDSPSTKNVIIQLIAMTLICIAVVFPLELKPTVF